MSARIRRMADPVKNQKSVYMRKRVRKAHGKAGFVGMLYLIATIFLAAMAFMPLLAGTPVGKMWVVNFWEPFKEVKSLTKGINIPLYVNLFVAVLYAILLLTVVINVCKSLSKLGWLFRKKRHTKYSFNCNVYAMEDMGAIFSGTYCALIVFLFMIHIVSAASFTVLFYLVLAIGLIIHFWAGLVGGNVSYFEEEGKTLNEEKRSVGRLAPFFRNVAQLVFVGLIMCFISKTNLMTNALKLLEKDAFTNLFKGAKLDLFLYGGAPLLQLLTCIWTVVLLKHATAATEFNFDGKEGSGMKNFRVFSFLILLTSGTLCGFMYYASEKRGTLLPAMGTFYIALIALAALIEEFCMCRLPNVKGKVSDEETDETVTLPEDSAENFWNTYEEAATPVNAAAPAPVYAPAYMPAPVMPAPVYVAPYAPIPAPVVPAFGNEYDDDDETAEMPVMQPMGMPPVYPMPAPMMPAPPAYIDYAALYPAANPYAEIEDEEV